MKTLIICLIFISLIGCKKNQQLQNKTELLKEESNQNIIQNTENDLVFSEENLKQNQEVTKSIKKEKLLSVKDDKTKLQELVVSKKFYKEVDDYILDYKYPYLNEKINPNYSIFNSYLNENYLNIEATENQILEDKELLCDTLKIKRFRDKRIIDYKIYNAKNNLISVLLYKENYYSGAIHSSYLFDCLNFDLTKHEFIYYNDFFTKNSENEIFTTLNSIISKGIKSGELFYDCWELSEGDFKLFKNNFVINDETIEFYFDDCVICPSYIGTYSIKIPIKEVIHLIKKYNNKPIIG